MEHNAFLDGVLEKITVGCSVTADGHNSTEYGLAKITMACNVQLCHYTTYFLGPQCHNLGLDVHLGLNVTWSECYWS
jgi:hypothetical protein